MRTTRTRETGSLTVEVPCTIGGKPAIVVGQCWAEFDVYAEDADDITPGSAEVRDVTVTSSAVWEAGWGDTPVDDATEMPIARLDTLGETAETPVTEERWQAAIEAAARRSGAVVDWELD